MWAVRPVPARRRSRIYAVRPVSHRARRRSSRASIDQRGPAPEPFTCFCDDDLALRAAGDPPSTHDCRGKELLATQGCFAGDRMPRKGSLQGNEFSASGLAAYYGAGAGADTETDPQVWASLAGHHSTQWLGSEPFRGPSRVTAVMNLTHAFGSLEQNN
jgi:hypothetical protein